MAEEPKPGTKRIDAGIRSQLHYRKLLPRWRFVLRELLIPVVRVETPYLASFQQTFRSPALDSYFAFTANLGTHTFFMVILPILFWCGRVSLGRALCNMLAAGVFFSGFMKDLLCIPRPLSPPLQRISRSHSAALEYGFPSTHSTNAVSVAVYALMSLRESSPFESARVTTLVEGLFVFYAVSIVLGRLYCGMHGFFDVIIGSLLGVLLAMIQYDYEVMFDLWALNGPVLHIFVITALTLILVRIHPEPADDCPCFDDSVAFAGVFIGLQLGAWPYARSGFAKPTPLSPSEIPFSWHQLGYIKSIARIILGIFLVFIWRGTMKPALLRGLPPLFRIIENLGLSLPRKFFLRATQYGSVPTLSRDDNVIPPASEIPSMLRSLRHPRKRAISIGPQSEADAYEAMAFRARKRRAESLDSIDVSKIPPANPTHYASPLSQGDIATRAETTAIRNNIGDVVRNPFPSDSPAVLTPMTLPNEPEGDIAYLDLERLQDEDDKKDREMFQRLQRPRVRYDVEVVTKLIVYSGIAMVSVAGAPIIFEIIGLGIGVRSGS